MTSKKILKSFPIPVTVTLFRSRVFADDQVKMRSLGSFPIQYIPYFKRGNLYTDNHTTRLSCEDEGGSWAMYIQVQVKGWQRSAPKTATRSHQRNWNKSPLTISEGTYLAYALISAAQPTGD
jgi:hypothetical protein